MQRAMQISAAVIMIYSNVYQFVTQGHSTTNPGIELMIIENIHAISNSPILGSSPVYLILTSFNCSHAS